MANIVLPAPVMALKKSLGPKGILIYACLVETCNEVGQTSVDYTTLQDMAGVSRAVVAKAIELLASHGLIVRQHRFRQSTIYTVVHYLNYHASNSSDNELLSNDSSTIELLTTTTVNPVESVEVVVNSSKTELLQNDSSNSELLARDKPPSAFTLPDAQALLMTLTGWARVPGNPGDALNALGVIRDIHDRHNSNTLEYLRPFWVEFKKRYPHSTKTFWLTEWAVQGVVPPEKGSGKPATDEAWKEKYSHA
jgi:hypothetical protein